jgi:hypothetical protein
MPYNLALYTMKVSFKNCEVSNVGSAYQVIRVDELASTKATPSQLNLPTSAKASIIFGCTSAMMVLSREKRNVEDRMVVTIRIHYT